LTHVSESRILCVVKTVRTVQTVGRRIEKMKLEMIVTETNKDRVRLRAESNGEWTDMYLPNHDGLVFGQRVRVLVAGEPPEVER
jgi:hypothetical protein